MQALYSVLDASPQASCTLSAISIEPADTIGDGHTHEDVIVVDARTLRLRAERAGGNGGREATQRR